MRILNVKTKDKFWNYYKDIIKRKVIPYQWKALNDELDNAEPSHAIKNFKIAAGLENGEYYGEVFQDSDVAKWIETVAYSLRDYPDKILEEKVDEVIDILGEAQEEDGYLNTYYILKEPDKKWTNLRDHHELYCAGHFIEAAVAYYQTTEKDKMINIMAKYVDLIDSKFGIEEGKIKGYPGHQEIELALLRLYEITENPKHLNLAKYFLYQRGQEPNYFEKEKEKRDETDILIWNDESNLNFGLKREYQQDHLPILDQSEAVGHAVRAVYQYTAMADLAKIENDKKLFDVTSTLWDNVVNKKMYITGGIGSSANGESFSEEYDLPNDTMYCETCASVGMTFWANRMAKYSKKSEYHDVLEREIFNGTISGMNLEGNRFFYVNPLEVNKNQEYRADQQHVLPERQAWFKTACCPPNLARMIASIDRNIYDIENDKLYVNQYIGNELNLNYRDTNVKVSLKSDFPWKGNVNIKVRADKPIKFKLLLRMPEWMNDTKIQIDNKEINLNEINNGYIVLDNEWHFNDVLLNFDMPVLEIRSNPLVRENNGKIALQRGPIVYCLEEIDNGPNLSSIILAGDTYKMTFEEHTLNGVVVISTEGVRREWGGNRKSYSVNKEEEYTEKIPIKAVPYYSWNNRGTGEMTVWINKY